jgi:hypothetical protein
MSQTALDYLKTIDHASHFTVLAPLIRIAKKKQTTNTFLRPSPRVYLEVTVVDRARPNNPSRASSNRFGSASLIEDDQPSRNKIKMHNSTASAREPPKNTPPVDKPIDRFHIPDTIATLCKMEKMYNVGLACGHMLHSIPSLVSRHLDHAADFHNDPPSTSISAVEFAAVVDAQIRFLRVRGGYSERVSNDMGLDRKGRRRRRKIQERYTLVVGKCLKHALREELGRWMGRWTKEQTESFNKGVDWGLTEMAWSRYPTKNVCLEAGEEDWGIWLRSRCEELGLRESKAGRRVFDESMFP